MPAPVGRGAAAPSADHLNVHDEVLGEGGFGIVFKGTIFQTREREVAVKTSKSETTSLTLEADILQMCRHPNVLGCLGLYVINGRQHLVTELADTDLGNILFYHTRLSEKNVAAVTEQMLLALQWLEESVVVRRDLKPANIFVMRYYDPARKPDSCYCKLGDFGTAAALPSAAAKLRQKAGTRGYSAPEMINKCYGISGA